MPTCDTLITLDRSTYRLQAQIGRSVYGTVWRANAPDGAAVALKLVNEERMAQAEPALRERWVASACNEIAFLRALAPWDNRHLVRLLDSGWYAGLPVLALELLPTDLARHLAQCRAAGAPPSFAQALDWLGQLNQALAKVHQYGWRYLDLKPANILLDPATGSLRLADFGTNRQLTLTEPHSYAGTAQWQAPEQFIAAAGGGYVTSQHSDYFALGALWYFIVTGTPLRWSSACGQAYREHLADGARHVLAAHGGMPPALLAPDEARRFGAAAPPEVRDTALALLRALLAPAPAARPRHALAISRLLAVLGNGQPSSHVERACALAQAA